MLQGIWDCACAHRAGRWRTPPAAGWEREPKADQQRAVHSGGLVLLGASAPDPSAPAPESPAALPADSKADVQGAAAGPGWGNAAWWWRVGRGGWRSSKAHYSGSERRKQSYESCLSEMGLNEIRSHLCVSRSNSLCGTVAEGLTQVPQPTDNVQVQLGAQLCQHQTYDTVTPYNFLSTLRTCTQTHTCIHSFYRLHHCAQ